MFTKEWFFYLDKKLRDAGLDLNSENSESFDVIKERLLNKEPLDADNFARLAIYVVFVSGFSQKNAMKIHEKVMAFLSEHSGMDSDRLFDNLIKIFANKNKINAVIKLWQNRNAYRDGYYQLKNVESKISYLQNLPHIGKITANHLARNLGEDVAKYDIWIQRLGVLYVQNPALGTKIDNGNLDPEIKQACDEMFAHLIKATGLPLGYIDVVLWKACQNHFIC